MTSQLNKFFRTTFNDFDLDMGLNPLTSDFISLSHVASVKKRVKTLVRTQLYDRPYQPALGSQVEGMLFENSDFATLKLIENMIIDLIREFEPSVELLSVGVSEFENGLGIQVQINFSVIAHHEQAELTIILNRVR